MLFKVISYPGMYLTYASCELSSINLVGRKYTKSRIVNLKNSVLYDIIYYYMVVHHLAEAIIYSFAVLSIMFIVGKIKKEAKYG